MNRSNSTDNERTITSLDEKLDKEVTTKSPLGVDWRWWAGMSVSLLLASLLASILVFAWVIPRRAQQSEDLENCRARYTAIVSDAQVNNDIAIDDVVLYLSSSPESRTEEERAALTARLKSTRNKLDIARDNRLEYERRLTLPCPIPAPDPDET